MSRICPLCGNVNDDTVRFCTSCGSPLVPQAGQPATATTPQPGRVSPVIQPGQKSTFTIIAVAVIATIVILAVLYFLQASGTLRIFPSAAPAATPRVTPVTTSYVTKDTPLPETTIPVPVITTDITNSTESPRISPAATKPLACPSDRLACGLNCTDIMTDQYNCGGCNVSCTIEEICQQGHCTAWCADTMASCPDGCHDLLSDAQNCGICGNICPFGLVCNRSVCTPPVKTLVPLYTG